MQAYIFNAIALAKDAEEVACGDNVGTLNVPPFESLKLFTMSLPASSSVAAFRSNEIASRSPPPTPKTQTKRNGGRIRVGYVTPDVAKPGHPLPYLMRDFWKLHDGNKFDVYMYSIGRVSGPPSSPGVKVKESVANFREFDCTVEPQTVKSAIER